MRNPTIADIETKAASLLSDQTGCPLAGGCRSCEITLKVSGVPPEADQVSANRWVESGQQLQGGSPYCLLS